MNENEGDVGVVNGQTLMGTGCTRCKLQPKTNASNGRVRTVFLLIVCDTFSNSCNEI